MMNVLCFEYSLVSVQYFLDEMQVYELNDLLNGINYKYRVEWEMIRTNSYLCTPKIFKKKLSKKEFMELPWDKEDEEILEKKTDISDIEIANLKKMAEAFQKNM